MDETAVTVVVASHRPDYMRELAARLSTRVTRRPGDELVVVADYDVTDLAALFPAVRWIFHADRSIPAKRNRGIREARGALVAFIDDDCMPQDDWLERGRACLVRHPEAAAAEGFTAVERPDGPGAHYREFRRLERQGYRTNNVFFRAGVLREAGGFDERFTVQREDIDLAFTVLEQGGVILFRDDIRVTHRYRPGEPWDLLKNCWNRRFDPLLYGRHRRLYRKHVGTPWTPSIAVCGLLQLTALAAAAAVPGMLPAAAAAALAFTAVVALRRTSFRPRGFAAAFAGFAASPAVLAAALVHGSVRFRTLLIV